jgi:hypothetical protein
VLIIQDLDAGAGRYANTDTTVNTQVSWKRSLGFVNPTFYADTDTTVNTQVVAERGNARGLSCTCTARTHTHARPRARTDTRKCAQTAYTVCSAFVPVLLKGQCQCQCF